MMSYWDTLGHYYKINILSNLVIGMGVKRCIIKTQMLPFNASVPATERKNVSKI